MDNDMKLMESMIIIYQTAEDGLADTVKPRLEKAGADCERILIIDESDKSLSMADDRLEEAIIQTGSEDGDFRPDTSLFGWWHRYEQSK